MGAARKKKSFVDSQHIEKALGRAGLSGDLAALIRQDYVTHSHP